MLLRREFRLGTELNAGGLGACNAFGCTFLDEVALELADGRQHVKQQTPGRAARIDGLVEDHEVNLLGGDLCSDLGEVENRTGEAVEPRHYERVTFTDEGQGLAQRVALRAGRAALLLLEDPVTAVTLELAELRLEILPDRRDAGVSDFHVS